MNIDKVTNIKTGIIENNRGISPLIDQFQYEENLNNFLHQLVINTKNNTPNISIQMIKSPITKNIKIENTFDLHDFILNNIEHIECDLTDEKIRKFVLPVYVNKAANNIAQKTKRAPSNVCIISENNLDLIAFSLEAEIDEKCYDYENTYKYVGTVVDTKYYVDKTGLLSDDYVILTYNGNSEKVQDGGLYAVIDDKNNVWLNEISNWKDYFQVLKLIK